MFYPLLNQVVAARHVAVIGNGADALDHLPRDTLTIRFNRSIYPADIWATRFHPTVQPPFHQAARFLVCSLPKEPTPIFDPTKVQRFRYLDRREEYFRSATRLPIEFMSQAHWHQLCYAMPLYPLSGIAVLAMLQFTDVEKVDIYGFSFYLRPSHFGYLADGAPPPIAGAAYCGVHAYIPSLNWLQRLLITDRRFHWHGEFAVERMLSFWKMHRVRRSLTFYAIRFPTRLGGRLKRAARRRVTSA